MLCQFSIAEGYQSLVAVAEASYCGMFNFLFLPSMPMVYTIGFIVLYEAVS